MAMLLSIASTIPRLLLPRRGRRCIECNNSFLSTAAGDAVSPRARSRRRQSRTGTRDADGDADSQPTANDANARADWREWFRSADYDDPWSSYHPAASGIKGGGGSSMSLHSAQSAADDRGVIRSMLGGTWERRRHGMNLEPLRLIHRDNTGVSGDSSKGGTDEKVGMEESVAKARRKMTWVDAQSRFLCRMLDDLYRTGIRRENENDRPRVERCHRMIGKLLTTTPEDPFDNGELVAITGLAQRTGAILERMELCSPIHTQTVESNSTIMSDSTRVGTVEGSKVLTNTNHTLEESTEGSPSSFLAVPSPVRRSYQDIHPDIPPHLLFTKFALPAPTSKIYNMALKAYGKEAGAYHVAQQAEDVIWSMIVRGLQQMQLTQSREMTAGVDEDDARKRQTPQCQPLFPSLENWNCVLKCWSKCTGPYRAYHSYSFLQTWFEWNEERQHNQKLRGVMNDVDLHYPDRESFQLVLNSCLVHDSEKKVFNNSLDFQRAKEMGSGVAIRFWKESRKLNAGVVFDSTMYCSTLRAISQSPELPSPSSKSKVLQDLVRVFTSCCEDGMATPDIFQVVRASTTQQQYSQLSSKLEKRY